jgi:uncharacterized membrane protein YbhN (UPF0104 family)
MTVPLRKRRSDLIAGQRDRLAALRTRARNAVLWLDEKPMVVVLAAAGATIGTVLVLCSYAGWTPVSRLVFAPHAWAWLLVCLLGEVAAYAGYALTIRDMARVDDGGDISLRGSAKVVVGGFGVFAATRGSGGFAVDYWAFRASGARRREAVARVLGLGFLEYAMLSIAALVASALLFLGVDGRAGYATTLPSLVIVPIAGAALWATSPARVRRLSRPRSGPVRRRIANGVAGAAYVRRLLASPREHGLGVLGNAIYWAGDMLCLWAALQCVGNDSISLSALVLAYSGGYVLTRRSLPAGGAGLVELALTLALVGMGLDFVPALVGVVIYRLFNFWLPIIPALILLPALRDLRLRLRKAERQPG